MDSEYNDYLDIENEKAARVHIGGIIFVATLMVVGVVGNSHVLFIYTFRAKPSNRRVFILVLGILDFITCIVGMPFIIFDLKNPLKFDLPLLCKIFRFNNYFICTASMLLLIVVAVDRYRKVCHPLKKQISGCLAKGLCLACLVMAFMLSSPAPILYGRETLPTSNPNVTGVRCGEENRYHSKPYMAYFNTGYIAICLVAFFVMVVLYSVMWRVIRTHLALRKQTCVTEFQNKSTPPTGEGNNVFSISRESVFTRSTHRKSQYGKKDDKKERGSVRRSYERKTRKAKTSLMFLFITAIFFLSYIPHFILKIAALVIKDFHASLSFSAEVVYHLFVWCFFINNVANPIVYLIFDMNFRSNVKALYASLLRCRRMKYIPETDISSSSNHSTD